MAAFNEKKDVFGEPGSFRPEDNIDTERRGSTTVGGRKMSRIGPPPRLGSIPGDSDQGEEQARLVAMEADNAIKYRTCSWQKVGCHPNPRSGSRRNKATAVFTRLWNRGEAD